MRSRASAGGQSISSGSTSKPCRSARSDDLVEILAPRERHAVDDARLAEQAIDLDREQHRAECRALLDEAVVAAREHRLADRIAADAAQAELAFERARDRALAGARKPDQRDDQRAPVARRAIRSAALQAIDGRTAGEPIAMPPPVESFVVAPCLRRRAATGHRQRPERDAAICGRHRRFPR